MRERERALAGVHMHITHHTYTLTTISCSCLVPCLAVRRACARPSVGGLRWPAVTLRSSWHPGQRLWLCNRSCIVIAA